MLASAADVGAERSIWRKNSFLHLYVSFSFTNKKASLLNYRNKLLNNPPSFISLPTLSRSTVSFFFVIAVCCRCFFPIVFGGMFAHWPPEIKYFMFYFSCSIQSPVDVSCCVDLQNNNIKAISLHRSKRRMKHFSNIDILVCHLAPIRLLGWFCVSVWWWLVCPSMMFCEFFFSSSFWCLVISVHYVAKVPLRTCAGRVGRLWILSKVDDCWLGHSICCSCCPTSEHSVI